MVVNFLGLHPRLLLRVHHTMTDVFSRLNNTKQTLMLILRLHFKEGLKIVKDIME